MLYTDPLFFVLFALLLAACAVLGGLPAARETLIVAFSALVIASWGLFDLGLFAVVLALNWVAAHAMQRASPRAARALLAATVAVDLGLLAAFKYAGFLIENLAVLAGVEPPRFAPGIPIAVSFYVFHVVSYVADVHAGRVRHTSFARYVFYLSYFPHVIAGPIVRAWQLVPQIGRARRSWAAARADAAMGLHFLVTGLFLKSVVADNIAQGIDPAWQRALGFVPSAADHWAVALLYYCQIYADFAGYSLMAIGMSRLLGYRLPANFRGPMRAASLREFWQRWHITLSRWLRDYLYIPLGGGRMGEARGALALMATMLLGGLWHGAAWGFVLWGALHGAWLLLERVLGMQQAGGSALARLPWWLATQIWVTLAWVLFRSTTLSDALLFLDNMTAFAGAASFRVHPEIGFLFLFALPVFAHQLAPFALRAVGRRRLAPALGAATGAMLCGVLAVESTARDFIYFRF